MGGHRPHAINSTDEFLSLVLDELQGIRGLLDERLPPPAVEPEQVSQSSAEPIPLAIKEPTPAEPQPPRKRVAKKATPAKTPAEE
jgi:hypothetical protein